MDNKLKLIADFFGRDRVKLDEPLSEYTALRIGGPSKLFFIAFTQQELIKIVSVCRQLQVPYFIFGTGSKIMISDGGFNGVVIKNRTKEIHTLSIKGKVSKTGIGVEEAFLEVDSGVSIGKFVEYLNTQNLLSNEFINIPGSMGGNLFLNKSLQSKSESIKVYNLDSKIEKISANTLNPKRHIILSAVLRIKSKQ